MVRGFCSICILKFPASFVNGLFSFSDISGASYFLSTTAGVEGKEAKKETGFKVIRRLFPPAFRISSCDGRPATINCCEHTLPHQTIITPVMKKYLLITLSL